MEYPSDNKVIYRYQSGFCKKLADFDIINYNILLKKYPPLVFSSLNCMILMLSIYWKKLLRSTVEYHKDPI